MFSTLVSRLGHCVQPIYRTLMVTGVTRGGKRAAISRAPNHYGDAKSLLGAPKSPNNVASTFFNSIFAFEIPSGSNMGASNLLIAPGAI